jgi:TPP-dependent pyruvate/acetoin dehydrogenase alpha subunit
VLKQTNTATDEAEALPYPSVDDMTTHVYAGAAYEPWLE